jgi:hypothetical protein
MKFTNEKPTVAGVYWLKDPSGAVAICKVEIYKDGPLVSCFEFVRLYDALVGVWQFAGPIPKPEELPNAHPVWNPIETAPKDGSEILVLFDSATVEVVRLCWWNDGSAEQNRGIADPEAIGWWSYRHSVTQEQLTWLKNPIAWMPMPDFPGERRD